MMFAACFNFTHLIGIVTPICLQVNRNTLAKIERNDIICLTGFHTRSNPSVSGDCAVMYRIQNTKMEHNMFNSGRKTKLICLCAVTAALYAALTAATAPFAYGAVQFRAAEALCVLPYFIPQIAWGVFAGCFVSNILSGNVFDVIFGSLATLMAALCTAYLGKQGRSKALACLMPVVFNGITVGAVITFAYEGRKLAGALGLFAVNALWVSLGEAAVMFAIGYPFMKLIDKNKMLDKFK